MFTTTVEFEKVPVSNGLPAKFEYHAVVPFVGGIVIRQEATTHAYPRGAANPRWFVYLDGVRRPGNHQTLAAAKQVVAKLATN